MTSVLVFFVDLITAMLLVQLVYVYVEKRKSFWLFDFFRALRAASEYVKMIEKDLAENLEGANKEALTMEEGGEGDEESRRKEIGHP